MPFSKIKNWLGEASSVFIGLATIIGIIYGFGAYVDYRVDKKVQSEDFLRRLSDSVRPSCIFDEKGSVLVDMGAMNFIDSIELSSTNGLPEKIIVHPKHYLANAPIRFRLEILY